MKFKKNLRLIFSVLLVGVTMVVGLVLMQQQISSSHNDENGNAGNEGTIVENNFDHDVVQKDIFNEVESPTDVAQNTDTKGSATTKTTNTTPKTTTTTPKTTTKPTAPAPTPAPKPVVPTSCPAQTQSCVPCKKSDNNPYCRFEPGKTTGYLGWSCQNNNPGNIRPSTTAYPHCTAGASYDRTCIIVNNGGPASCGVRTDSRGGTYMIFKTYTDGRNALRAYLTGINKGQHKAYTGCGNCSLRFMLGKYSSNTSTYPDGVAKKLGVNADTTTLAWVISNGKLEQLVDAIQAQEGFFTR